MFGYGMRLSPGFPAFFVSDINKIYIYHRSINLLLRYVWGQIYSTEVYILTLHCETVKDLSRRISVTIVKFFHVNRSYGKSIKTGWTTRVKWPTHFAFPEDVKKSIIVGTRSMVVTSDERYQLSSVRWKPERRDFDNNPDAWILVYD